VRKLVAAAIAIILFLTYLAGSATVYAEEPGDPATASPDGVSTSEESPIVEPIEPIAPTPNTSGGSGPVGSDVGSSVLEWLAQLDPRKWAVDALDALLSFIGTALLGGMRSFIDWALGFGDSSLNFVTRTPPAASYASSTVRGLWDFSRALLNAALAVIVMWGGFNVMVKEHTRSPYHEVMEMLPRIILAALAGNLTLELARFLIEVNNAISGAVGQVGLPGYDQATQEQQGIALIFTALAYGIVAILLVFQMLMRLALIDILIVIAPLAALLWVLPQTQGWARWWADLFPVTIFQQAVQMIALRLGAALMVELTPGSVTNALVTLLLGIAVCWLTLKIPSLLRSRGSQAGLWNVVTLVAASRAIGGLAGRSRASGTGSAGTSSQTRGSSTVGQRA
jgi:hypothetical protein